MVEETVKCLVCGVGLKIEVCVDKRAEEADIICRQCDVKAKIEKMTAAQSELMMRITELQNPLVTERDMMKATREGLKATEEELLKVGMVTKGQVGRSEWGSNHNTEADDNRIICYAERQCF